MLVHSLKQYDVALSKEGKNWSEFSLPRWLQRVDEVMLEIERGTDERTAICRFFRGEVLRVALRSIGETPTEEELTGHHGSGRQTWGGWL